MKADLPAGTVTFLFTDIEGSTRLLEELGAEAYAVALAGHRRVVRDAIARHGGVEVDTQGDSFFVAFSDANAAVTAAAEAQRDLADHQVRVRMGLHTGTARVADGGYVGGDVHLGARIAAAGHGGQVLLSGATRGLVKHDTVDLGQHRLKDFDSPLAIYQLGHDRFPPLRTISNTNLPRPASALVGRTREIAEVTARLQNGARLLTLTGPGGMGKTRLAIESATELVAHNRNGVFWVPLASLSDPALVMSEVAQTLGAKGSVVEHVGAGEMLLLLDNFEQVVDAAPELGGLLQGCPNLRLLVTSRERLRVAGEVEYAVPPLADPEAAELFSARSGIANDDVIAELCRRLDNLPLAVELAAARASVLSPAQMLERLGQRLDLLKGGRDADARQQTLRATIEWSHDLLNEAERALFARLAVFHGGCTLDAAEQVISADIDTLQSLVDKSLLRFSDERYWMLETIREFALSMLGRLAEADELKAHHADYFLALAREAEPNMRMYSADWLARLERDHDNLRAALDYFAAAHDATRLMTLTGSLTDLWAYGGHVQEGWQRVTAALATDAQPSAARARVLVGAADLADNRGDTSSAKRLSSEGLAIYTSLGEKWWMAYALGQLGLAAIEDADYDGAKRNLRHANELFREVGDELWTIANTRALAWAHEASGDRSTARELHEANLPRALAVGARETAVGTLGSLSMLAADDGRVADALSLVRQNLTAAVELGSPHTIGQALCRVADICIRFLQNPVAGAQLLGCFDGMGDQIGVSEAWVARENAKRLADAAAQLDPSTLAEAQRRGRAMTMEQGVAFALEQLGQASG
jgi:predicted ATPase